MPSRNVFLTTCRYSLIKQINLSDKKYVFIKNSSWDSEPTMNEGRVYGAAAMFEGDDSIWWVSGGSGGYSTEIFNTLDNSFTFSIDLPKALYYHNLVNVNNTHMVVLGGQVITDEIFIFDKYTMQIK